MSLINDGWNCLFDKYKIDHEIKNNGLYYITADQIREFKEPRLMTKFDTRESLPSAFGGKYAILPVTRGSYVMGEFELYFDFPEQKSGIEQIKNIQIPEYFETIDINRITSEANAINVMSIASILEDFLQEEKLVQTISGRMGSGNFSFLVNGRDKSSHHIIDVLNSQVEIDGGFEGRNIFAIIEGKNVVHSNFLIRQLYYPFRLWRDKIQKSIRPVFMVYSNNVFRLLEYEFTINENYSSIQLLQEKNYSLEDVKITAEDLRQVYYKTSVRPEPDVTFVQADSFEKVISLVEHLEENSMTKWETADLFGFQERQSDYYFNACRYLGLAQKSIQDGERRFSISKEGKRLLRLPYKQRQLEYVKLILEHQIFNEVFYTAIMYDEIPDKGTVAARMRELNLCSENLIKRRVSSVSAWIRWILHLTAS